MIPILQTTFGKQGNCFAACLASIFEEPLEKWEPTANHRPDWKEQTERLLAEKGLELNEVSTTKDGEMSTAPLLMKNLSLRDGGLYLLGVQRTSDELPHVIIGRYDKSLTIDSGRLMFYIEHDPMGRCADEIREVQAVLLISHRF